MFRGVQASLHPERTKPKLASCKNPRCMMKIIIVNSLDNTHTSRADGLSENKELIFRKSF